MALNLVRTTLTGTREAIQFAKASSNYIVKNFSSGSVLVAFDSDATDEKSIKIPSGMGQVCSNTSYGVDTVYVKGTGEVEVQQL